MTLRKRKITRGSYYVIDDSGRTLARLDKTGTRRDNYPWNWYLWGKTTWGDLKVTTVGNGESAKSIMSMLNSYYEQHGVEWDNDVQD